MNVVWAKTRIKALDDGKWAYAMDEAGDYHHLDTLSKVQDGNDCANWKVFALLDYMERAIKQREPEEL